MNAACGQKEEVVCVLEYVPIHQDHTLVDVQVVTECLEMVELAKVRKLFSHYSSSITNVKYRYSIHHIHICILEIFFNYNFSYECDFLCNS